MLRNVAPAGAQEITINQAAIQATGATSTDQFLATIPQLSAFGTLRTANAGGTQLTVNQTNIRNLPQGTGGSSPTLVLVDGHRIIGVGAKQAYPDPDVIPPALVQRVDVLTDGGSASYGSDAIGGVINIITRDKFDGVAVSGRQGLADSFRSTDINVTAGKTWETGGFYVGYNYSHHSALQGGDRDYIRNIDYTTGQPIDLNCNPGNVRESGNLYAIVNANSLRLSNANKCDLSQTNSYYPRETRHSVIADFNQELTPDITFDVKGYYSQRSDFARQSPLAGTATVTSANPFYIPTAPGDAATQNVYFDFGPVGGTHNIRTKIWAYGITPTVTWKISPGWQVRAFYNYGQSRTTADDPAVNSTALGASVAAGLVNPYNIAQSNPAAIGQALDYVNFGLGKDKLSNAKVIADGPLFRLPGGMVQVAVGAEYIYERYTGFVKTDTRENVDATTPSSAHRNVKSGFGELNIPIVSADNNVPLISSLTVAASVRYDHYSDFGGNWAPNVGVTWKPIRWVSLRGRWNKSFQAPSLVQLSQQNAPYVLEAPGFIINAVPLLRNPNVPVPAVGGALVAIYGAGNPLKPERARDYNLGIDISPPFVPGLNLHMTYWNINYTGQISSPPLGSGPFYEVPGFQGSFIMLPTIAQIQSFLAARGASATDIATAVGFVNATGGNPYVVADVRSRNLGITKTHGFDFSLDYSHPVSFGSIEASFGGSLTQYAVNAADGTNFLPNQAGLNSTGFNSVGRIGTRVGSDFFGQVSWYHLGGYRASPAAQLNQTRVGSFNTIDLYLQYDLKQGSLPPITLSLGIENLFDQDPPLFRGVYQGRFAALGGYANASTIGRLFQLGAAVKF